MANTKIITDSPEDILVNLNRLGSITMLCKHYGCSKQAIYQLFGRSGYRLKLDKKWVIEKI